MTTVAQPSEASPVARVLQSVPVIETPDISATTARRVRTMPWRRRVTYRALAHLLAASIALTVVAVLAGPLPTPVTALVPAVWLCFLAVAGGFHAGVGYQRGSVRPTLQAAAALGLTCWVVTTMTTTVVSSQSLLLLTAVLTVGSATAQSAADAWSARAAAATRVPVVLAGRAHQVTRALTELESDHRHGFDVVAVCLREDTAIRFGDLPTAIGFENLTDLASERGHAVIVLPDSGLEPKELRFLGWQLEASGTQLYLGTGLLDTAPARTVAATAGGLHLLHIRTSTRWNAHRLIKAAWESSAAALGLLALLPLLLLLAVAIRVTSPGAAIFRQSRVGKGGRTFTMYKFRTMVLDAEIVGAELTTNDADGVLFKLRADPRITPIGRVLRRYSLDELPQLINVALGDMSLVGPRPALPSEVERYDLDPRRRLAVRPGLTGLWQVSGRSDLTWEQSVRLDLFYVDNWSLGLDLTILRRTIRAVLGHQGAY